jgi:hypothetical protein
MNGTLGISIAPTQVHGMLVTGRRIRWAGEASYTDIADLAVVIARLGSEAPRSGGVRIVLERPLLQMRCIHPVPPLKRPGARQYVVHEAGRLFRRNGHPLLTDAVTSGRGTSRVLIAVAAAEDLVRSAIQGCEKAHLRVASVGIAADILPAVVQGFRGPGEVTLPNGTTTEVLEVQHHGVVRSRLVRGVRADAVRWRTPLETLGSAAGSYAAAFAASQSISLLQLLPPDIAQHRDRRARRRTVLVAGFALLLWLAAGGIHLGRLVRAKAAADQERTMLGPAVDTVFVLRQNLGAVTRALETMTNARVRRSHVLRLLAEFTGRLPDQAFLINLTFDGQAELRATGFAAKPAEAVAGLRGSTMLADVQQEPAANTVAAPGPPGWEPFGIRAGSAGPP